MINEVAWPANRPLVEKRFRCEVVAPTKDGLLEQFAEMLRAEGFFVAKAQKWEKTNEFRKRLGLAHHAFHRILKHPACPAVEVDRRSGGNITTISSNPVFEEFCVAQRGATPKRVKGVRKKRHTPTIAEGRPSRRKPENLLQRRRMNGTKRSYV